MAQVTSGPLRAELRALNQVGARVERAGIGTASLAERELRDVADRKAGLPVAAEAGMQHWAGTFGLDARRLAHRVNNR